MTKKRILTFLAIILVAFFISFLPPPQGIDPKAMKLLGIFLFTILGMIFKPFPMGLMALLGLVAANCFFVLGFEQSFAGFKHPVVWLIVLSFFVAKSFVATGLGRRIAYHLMRVLGHTTMGMGYGIVLADLILAPAIPSNTARSGGILYPIVRSLSEAYDSHPHAKPKALGAYLIQTLFQGVLVTSAMFLTSMAGNPLVASFAKDAGVVISWSNWALAALVPGLASLALVPFILYKIYPPEIRATPKARDMAKQELSSMGKISRIEKILVIVFFLLIASWVFGGALGISATQTALYGISILLLFGVLKWDDIISEKSAWNTFIWFASLVTLASGLNQMGLTTWFSDWFALQMEGIWWGWAMLFLSLIYFYSHYFFASNVAHICSMYPPFLLMAISLGCEPLLAALLLGFISSLWGGITHYGCGPAAFLFGVGYNTIKDWWFLGLVFSVMNLLIWGILGTLWWKILGLW